MSAGKIFDWLGLRVDRVAAGSQLVKIPVNKIHPGKFQPRRTMDQAELDSLAKSIREIGVLQPVVVRPSADGGFELVTGERRWRAAKAAGLKEIPAILRPLDDADTALAGLIENLQREDLSYWDEAAGYDNLLKNFPITQGQLAKALGKSQSTIANKVRLLKLPESIRRQIQAAGLGERHARALLRVPDPVAQTELLNQMVEGQLSASEAEDLIDRYLRGEGGNKPRRQRRMAKLKAIKDVRIMLNTFRQGVETLRQAGLPAEIVSEELEDHIEIRIRIPKEHN